LGQLKTIHIVMAVAGCLCLMVPLVGSFYPSPPWPLNIFPAIFVLYLLGGGAWLYMLNRRAPGTLGEIEASLEAALQESTVPASDVERGARVGLAYPAVQGATASM
jgi:hypothetical protein